MKKSISEHGINQTHRTLKRVVTVLLHNRQTTHGLSRALRHVREELHLYENHVHGSANRRAHLSSAAKVQIGGGYHPLPGWLNIDIIPPADVICDVRQGMPLKTGSAELIFSEHFLEHIDYPKSVKYFFRESARVLRPGGKMIVGVPDGGLAARKYVRRDVGYYRKLMRTWYKNRNCRQDINSYIDLLNYHFRDQDDDLKYHPHFWAYDDEKMISLFRQSGFKNIHPWRFDKTIANPKRKFGSLYYVGTR